ncbi:ABC-F type ribosomal protection protein [Enterococcus hirae]|nr:ABC-F type ribosomal protection protein [Enterococcus hirae]
MILLQASDLARFFGADVLFEHLNIEIEEKSRIALVGRNGAGKSTLLKMLVGEESPDAGQINQKKNMTLGYLAQNAGFNSEKTVWKEMISAFDPLKKMEARMHVLEAQMGESADPQIFKEYDQLLHDFEAKNGYGYESETRSVLHGFSFDESFYEQPINTLSGGQKTRLALAKLLLLKPDLLVLDEPTNHLDIETLSWLENYLQGYSGALLIVSHDRYFLDKIATEVLELSRHHLKKYTGNYSRYLDQKAVQLASEWKQYEKQQTEISKMEDFVNRNLARASTTKRAQSRQKALAKMDRMDRPQNKEKSAHYLFHIDRTSGNIVLELEDGVIGYEDAVISQNIELDIRKGDAIALIGPNGVGKSTLLKGIVGLHPLLAGKMRLGTNVDIGYYDQEQQQLVGNKTVLAELWDEHPTTPEKEIRTVLGNFLFSGDDVKKTVNLLSGGEKARLSLAKLAMQAENFLILDEPTNHLDIDNKEVLENALIDYPGTLFFVSHDRYFINRLANKVVELTEDGSKLYLGDYDYYLEKKQEELEINEAAEAERLAALPEETTKKPAFKNKDQQKLERSLERKIAALEEELAKLDEAIDRLQAKMIEPDNLNDHEKLLEIDTELKAVQQKQEERLDEWESLSIELEEVQKKES